MTRLLKLRAVSVIVFCVAGALFSPSSWLDAWLGQGNRMLYAQVDLGGRPPLVRFMGTLYPREEEGQVKKMKEGMSVLRVNIKGSYLIFRVEDVINVTGNMRGHEILRNILPPNLYLTEGKREAIDALLNREILRKSLTIEGLYFRKNKELQVMSVSRNAEDIN